MATQFFKQKCRHCQGGIEFDASGLESGETIDIDCPHCGSKITLLIPIPDEERKRYELISTTNSLIETLVPIAKSYFYGQGADQNTPESYKWILVICKLSDHAGVDFFDPEIAKIFNLASDAMTDFQIKKANISASKVWIAMITGQDILKV